MGTKTNIYSGYDAQYPNNGKYEYYPDPPTIPLNASVFVQYKNEIPQRISNITNFRVTFSPDETIVIKGDSSGFSWTFTALNSMGDTTETEVYIAIYYELDGGDSGGDDSGSEEPTIDEMISCDVIFSECGLLWLTNISYNKTYYNYISNYLKKITYNFYDNSGTILYSKIKSRAYYDDDLQKMLYVDFAHDDNGNITDLPDGVNLGIFFEFSGGDKYTDKKYFNYAITLHEEIWGRQKFYLDIVSANQKNSAELEIKYKTYFGVKECDWIMGEKPSEKIVDAMTGDMSVIITFSFLGDDIAFNILNWKDINTEHTFILSAEDVYKYIPVAISSDVSTSIKYWYDLSEPVVDVVGMSKTFTLTNWPSIARFHFKNIADAIREKRKINDSLTIRDMVREMYYCFNFPIDDYPPENLISGYENANVIECVKMMAKLYRCYLGSGEEVGDTPVKLERIADIIKNIT